MIWRLTLEMNPEYEVLFFFRGKQNSEVLVCGIEETGNSVVAGWLVFRTC